jgi:hypothetical protein
MSLNSNSSVTSQTDKIEKLEGHNYRTSLDSVSASGEKTIKKSSAFSIAKNALSKVQDSAKESPVQVDASARKITQKRGISRLERFSHVERSHARDCG